MQMKNIYYIQVTKYALHLLRVNRNRIEYWLFQHKPAASVRYTALINSHEI